MKSATPATGRFRRHAGRPRAVLCAVLLAGALTPAPAAAVAERAAALPTPRDTTDTCDAQQSPRFSDALGTTHEYSINCVAGWRITTGKTATTYEPSSPLTRGQTATFLVNALAAAEMSVPEPAAACSEDDVHVTNLGRLIAAGIVPARRPGLRHSRADQP